MVGINEGGLIQFRPLPAEAQFGAVRASMVQDFDGDGKQDLLVAGGLYQSEVETPRSDANTGVLLKGDGAGNFTALSFATSGLDIAGDVRFVKTVKTAAATLLLVVLNNGEVRVLRAD